eukprot:761857-Hanusia_phi.AAC.1
MEAPSGCKTHARQEQQRARKQDHHAADVQVQNPKTEGRETHDRKYCHDDRIIVSQSAQTPWFALSNFFTV